MTYLAHGVMPDETHDETHELEKSTTPDETHDETHELEKSTMRTMMTLMWEIFKSKLRNSKHPIN
ncbi:hypothetical protein AMTR_s00012p00248780 [Amborella trichopoda]|uniref:Uncharacterized protein n=1 Tax=Amborella trichopoda TaxID=13333 RepID=W1PDE6_AMBTC|nr:hypothetical protein AMTR_s00012p00248780 [Amborella trichopoda]